MVRIVSRGSLARAVRKEIQSFREGYARASVRASRGGGAPRTAAWTVGVVLGRTRSYRTWRVERDARQNASSNEPTIATGFPRIVCVDAPRVVQPRISIPAFASQPFRMASASLGYVVSSVGRCPRAARLPAKTWAALPPPHTRTRKSFERGEVGDMATPRVDGDSSSVSMRLGRAPGRVGQ